MRPPAFPSDSATDRPGAGTEYGVARISNPSARRAPNVDDAAYRSFLLRSHPGIKEAPAKKTAATPRYATVLVRSSRALASEPPANVYTITPGTMQIPVRKT